MSLDIVLIFSGKIRTYVEFNFESFQTDYWTRPTHSLRQKCSVRSGGLSDDHFLNNFLITRSALSGSLISTWLWLSLLEAFFLFATSGPVFYYYYARSQVTYEKWCYKSNPKFPSAEKVRDEIVQMMKGMLCASVCPAVSLELAKHGYSQAFCGWGGFSLSFHVATFLLTWVASDLFEFLYHKLGHTDLKFWRHHKHHHVFHNPSPFSVIADEPVDQIFRASPLLFIPLLIPINMDLLFIQ